MPELNPREIIEVQDSAGTNERGVAVPNAVDREVLYADGRVEMYQYDATNPPPSGDIPWGRLIGRRIDRAQKQLWDEEVRAEKEREKIANARPTATLPAGAAPARLDTPAVIMSKIAQARSAGVSEEDIAEIFGPWDLATGQPAPGVVGGGGGGGGSTRVRFPDEIAENEAQIANYESQIAERDAKLPGSLAYQSAQTAKLDQDIADLKRKALPQQQQILQEAFDTINYIQGQITQGTIQPADADAYFKSVDDYVKAGLQGATPYEIWKEQTQAETARARSAVDLLNQRISSGASLASSMNRDYTDALTANGGLLVNPGPYNPVEHAKSTVDDLGGGPQMASLAQALLEPLRGGVGDPGGMGGGFTNSAIQAILNGGGGEEPMIAEEMVVDTVSQEGLSPEGQAWLEANEVVAA